METGKIWWIADNQEELESWNLESKGAKIIEAQPEPSTGQIHVVFELDRARAADVLGYEPDEEEWLCDDSSSCPCCTA